MTLRCADLFCGAGGFSEGFRQAGFVVTKGLDIWAPAVLTHAKNHPDTAAIRGDILSYEPKELGQIDVLIGSPPCTEFSFANRGGGGDIEAGLRLVYRFLRFVYELQPRWWVMENVPRTLEFLPSEVPLRKLGIDKKGVLEIPIKTTLLSADFGVPQKRLRAFSGNFPIPLATHSEFPTGSKRPWRTLHDVLTSLGDPEMPPQLGESVTDPVYGFALPANDLTDHYSAHLRLTDEEVRENRKAKEDHSWYGRMCFPDELDRPGRTVMATQLRVSRETTVVSAREGYRRLSVREASSVQGFPITYQWWGASESLKYKLVGNAVAPPVAYHVAREILRAAEQPVPRRPRPYELVVEAAPDVVNVMRRSRPLPVDRKFREHIPGARVAGFRVDIDNRGGDPLPHPAWSLGRRRAPHTVRWRAMLYRGSGKAVTAEEVALTDALRLLAATVSDDRSKGRASAFVQELMQLELRIPDATSLQAGRSGRAAVSPSAYEVLDILAEIVRRHYDTAQTVVSIGSRRPDAVPRRVAAFLVAASFACAVMNRGTAWARANESHLVAPDPAARRRPISAARMIAAEAEHEFKRSLGTRRRTAVPIEEYEQLTIRAGA